MKREREREMKRETRRRERDEMKRERERDETKKERDETKRERRDEEREMRRRERDERKREHVGLPCSSSSSRLSSSTLSKIMFTSSPSSMFALRRLSALMLA